MKKRLFKGQCAHVNEGCDYTGDFETPAPQGWVCDACKGTPARDCNHGKRWAKDGARNGYFTALAVAFVLMIAFGRCAATPAACPAPPACECPAVAMVCRVVDSQTLYCVGSTAERVDEPAAEIEPPSGADL